MMTQQLGFSILTAPLAAIDRRALSQAWYSALHLVHARQAPPEPARLRGDVPACEHSPHLEQPRSRALQPGDAQMLPRQARSKATTTAVPERRAQRSVLARRIERTFLNPIARPQRATFTIDGTRTRVHVALQSSEHGVRLVAVCPPSIRTSVSRALDEARYALAARGIAMLADVNEG